VRCLVISDIHSNLGAFQAVLADAGKCDQVWCLGDVIGYGPQPNECVDLLKSLPHICVAGNHDWAAIAKLEVSAFNPDALRACLWTRERLTHGSWEFVEKLPERLVEGRFTVVHGSPRYPIWEYITQPALAEVCLAYFDTPCCLFGHTHRPAMIRCEASEAICDETLVPLGEPVALGDGRLLINPGGVGQPRDNDPRASYAVLDLEAYTVEYRRVPYPIEETQELMLSQGLPPRLAWRLSVGW